MDIFQVLLNSLIRAQCILNFPMFVRFPSSPKEAYAHKKQKRQC